MTVSFISYIKDNLMFVTSPQQETFFINWLNSVSNSSDYGRETHTAVGVRCSPFIYTKREAVILSIVKDDKMTKPDVIKAALSVGNKENVYEKEIWNAAIEAAAELVHPDNLERLRKLKK